MKKFAQNDEKTVSYKL